MGERKRWWPEILLIVLGVCSVLILTGYVLFSFSYRSIIVSALSRFTSRNVSLSATELRFPVRVTIKDLKIEDLFETKKAKISLNLIALAFGDIVFSEIVLDEPKLSIDLAKPLVDSGEQAAGASGQRGGLRPAGSVPASAAAGAVSDSGIFSGIGIKHFRIIGGEVSIIDREIMSSGLRIFLDDVDVDVGNLYLAPKPVITTFGIKARMPWREDSRAGSVYFSGWINLYKKDMQADLKIEGIDGVYLSPYYAEWVDIEGARINEARLNFSSDIRAANNDLTAKCFLELADIKFNPRPEDESLTKAEKITSAILDTFRALDKGKVKLNFTLNTTMDNPRFGIDAIRAAVDAKIAAGSRTPGPEDLIILPVKFLSSTLKGTIKGTTEVSKALVDGTIEVGREMKKSIEGAFRKQGDSETETD